MSFILGYGLGVLTTIATTFAWFHREELAAWIASIRNSRMESRKAREHLRMDAGDGPGVEKDKGPGV